MLLHNLRIAQKSLKRNVPFTVLIVGGIALGIALSTSFSAVRHAFAQNPLPKKTEALRYVRLDNWDPAAAYPADGPNPLPPQVTYRDVTALMRSTIPLRQAGMFKSALYVHPDPKVGAPFKEMARLTFGDFFAMFDVPFRYGGAWDKKADEAAEPVAVLSEDLNAKLFGGANSVGKTLRIDDRDFRVVGVLDAWLPKIKFYDLTQNATQPPERLFLPFNLLKPMKLNTSGNSDGWGPSPAQPGFEGLTVSEQCWLQFWVELPTAAARGAYEDFVRAYIGEQKKIGRFQRPTNYRLSTIPEWMADQRVVPRQVTALVWVSYLFLAICSLNLVGLLLGKFLARAQEVGVRRALGASRLDVFLQHIVECELIGVVGGAVGMLLSIGILKLLNDYMKTFGPGRALFSLDAPMVALSVGLSLLAGLVAGSYPAWRICRVAPAQYLKLG